MKLRLLVSSLIILAAAWNAVDAFAEDTPSTPPAAEKAAPPPPAAPAKFYLEVDQSDLNAISQALNELPKRVADPLILKLQAQLSNQAIIEPVATKALDQKKRK